MTQGQPHQSYQTCHPSQRFSSTSNLDNGPNETRTSAWSSIQQLYGEQTGPLTCLPFGSRSRWWQATCLFV